MKGLFYKDIINLKQQLRIYVLIIALWLVMSISNAQPGFFGGLMTMFTVMIPMTAISYDEKAKWERYAMTMPVSKSDMVLSKYLLAFVCGIAGQLVALVADTIISGDFAECAITAFTLLSVGVIFADILLPLLFKFGVEKGRYVIIIVVLIPTALTMLLPKDAEFLSSEVSFSGAAILLPIFAVIATVISIAISKAIYAKKEF